MKNAYRMMLVVCATMSLFCGNLGRAQTEFNLVDGEPIHSQSQIDSLKTGDTVMMVCATCKAGMMATYNSDPGSPGHVEWLKPGFKKVCPICGGTLTTVRRGDKIVLVCSKCGDVAFVTAFKTASK